MTCVIVCALFMQTQSNGEPLAGHLSSLIEFTSGVLAQNIFERGVSNMRNVITLGDAYFE
jgi:hypothetical protein